jgi:gamma-glutamyl-gamma-aminobutyrate hydrolase PuuD
VWHLTGHDAGGAILTIMSPAGQRPLIGVSTYRQITSWWAWERDAALVPGAYLDMVEVAGGDPLLIPPPAGSGSGSGSGPHRYDRLVGALDGLLLIGGGDIDPGRYGQEANPDNGGTNRLRDDLEIGLLDAALARDLPVLAVCRGLQLLNVALGGDLVQKLPDVIGSRDHQPRAGAFGEIAVRTEEGSTVRRLLGEQATVLCCHHQAVATPGRGVRITARSADGVVEAVELPGHRFVVGVQWHPEEAGDARLFEALVAAAQVTSTVASATAP